MNDYVGCVCSVCNKPFAAGDDIVVCPECGTPTEAKCPNCGAKLPANSKFCPECGSKVR